MDQRGARGKGVVEWRGGGLRRVRSCTTVRDRARCVHRLGAVRDRVRHGWHGTMGHGGGHGRPGEFDYFWTFWGATNLGCVNLQAKFEKALVVFLSSVEASDETPTMLSKPFRNNGRALGRL